MIGQIDIEKTLRLQPNKECLFVSVATVLNHLVDVVNKLQESVQGVVDNSIKDGAYIQALEDQVKEIKQYLDWDEISGENTQNSTNNSENSHLFQGNGQIADTSKKIKRAADSANKNLDNALEVAIEGLTYMQNNCLSYAVDYMDYANGVLEKISKILKITKGSKDENK